MAEKNTDRRTAQSVSLSTARKNSTGSKSGSVTTIFAIIVIAIVLINIPQFVNGNTEYKGFAQFFDMLEKAPVIGFDWIDDTFKELDREIKLDFSNSLGFVIDFSWILTPINWFINLFGGIAFIGTGIVQMITYIVYFIPFIFGF